MQTRHLENADASWASGVIQERWGGPWVISKGRPHDTRHLPGLVAAEGDQRLGLLLYAREGREIEVVTLDALEQRRGIGRLLLEALCAHAERRAARRIWLVTTNNNVEAIAFYTRCGYRLVSVRLNAVTQAREIKRHIPVVDEHGVRVQDELEFEKWMSKTTRMP